MGCSPWGRKESDTTERLQIHFHYPIPGASSEALQKPAETSPAMQEMRVRSLGQEDPLEKEMATHSSILAWRIPWMQELGGL